MTVLGTAADVARIGFDVIGAIWPTLEDAIRGGTQREILEASLRASITAAERVARARVEGRAGRRIEPLLVAAVHVEDAADELAALGQAADAASLREIARKYRAG